MSHFYSSISGSRGPATRAGTAQSGISGYVQSWQARLDINMHHVTSEDRDDAEFRLHGGPSNYDAGALALHFTNVSTIVDALGVSDPKIQAIRERIYNEIEKLNAEAPKALERAERRKAKEMRAQRREERRVAAERKEIRITAAPEEKARLVKLLHGVELDREGNFAEDSVLAMEAAKMHRGEDGHVYVEKRIGRGNWPFTFDVTEGRWVMPWEPLDDLGLTLEDLGGFGYRVEKEEATA
jgi:hypothetical protein